ncbi:MAG TPA: hypothetical protein VF017_12250 [Thermoanaerobaculia bacterium]|nr:hypothetical protein [Thermoanaerobaculia bacterium]
MRPLTHRLVLAGLYLVLLGAAAYFAARGASYYATPLAERARHPLYWQLKPGGELGLLFGVAGATMMVVMLAYSLRKRLRVLRRAGTVGQWLDYHILLGISGPVFILLHSSFKVGGLVALSFWSMVAVAASGVFGRFLYSQIPRSRAGDELSLAEAERLDAELARALVEDLGLPAAAVRELDELATQGADPCRSLFALALSYPRDRLALGRRLRRFEREHPQVARGLRRRYHRLVERKARLRLRLLMWQRLREVFHYWHVLHKPFAIVMYLFMVVHVAVAWMTGYAWVGS